MWLFYIVGFTFLLYPFVSNSYHQWVQKNVAKEYQEKVVSHEEKELKKIKERMQKHNQKLLDQQSVMSPEDFGVEAEQNVQQGVTPTNKQELGDVVAILEIPKIKLQLPVYFGTNEQQISNGAGVMKETSMPYGGESTHSVITSHRGLPTAKLFTDLPELKKKDTFFLNVAGETHAYEIDRIKIVEPDDFSELEVIKDRDYVTLLTCTPYMINSHRLLVRGHRVTPYTPKILETAKKQGFWHQLYKYSLYTLAALAIFLLFVLLKKYRERKAKQKKRIKKARIPELALVHKKASKKRKKVQRTKEEHKKKKRVMHAHQSTAPTAKQTNKRKADNRRVQRAKKERSRATI